MRRYHPLLVGAPCRSMPTTGVKVLGAQVSVKEKLFLHGKAFTRPNLLIGDCKGRR
jgi:hypothetical protein